MIVDTNKFKAGAATLQPDTLLVVEEMPGHHAAIDRTPTLSSQGYWSSYNVASDPFIYNISDSWAAVSWSRRRRGARCVHATVGPMAE